MQSATGQNWNLLCQLVIISSPSQLVLKFGPLLMLLDLCTHGLSPLFVFRLHLVHLKLLHVGLVFLGERGERERERERKGERVEEGGEGEGEGGGRMGEGENGVGRKRKREIEGEKEREREGKEGRWEERKRERKGEKKKGRRKEWSGEEENKVEERHTFIYPSNFIYVYTYVYIRIIYVDANIQSVQSVP